MGLFDFLKFGKANVGTSEAARSIPTITPDGDIFDCYAEVFKKVIDSVTGITPVEKSEIYDLISKSDGGFQNMGAYHSKIYDKYFKGRDWAWVEYDKWNDLFSSIGRFPNSFQSKTGPISVEGALGLLTVAELKELLKSKNIEFKAKDKKPDLICLANNIADIDCENIIRIKIAEELEKGKHEIYTILMRTINFRGKSLYDYRRAKKIGVKKFEIVQTFESDREFADIALKENPNALPPLYPYDLSYLKSVIDF